MCCHLAGSIPLLYGHCLHCWPPNAPANPPRAGHRTRRTFSGRVAGFLLAGLSALWESAATTAHPCPRRSPAPIQTVASVSAIAFFHFFLSPFLFLRSHCPRSCVQHGYSVEQKDRHADSSQVWLFNGLNAGSHGLGGFEKCAIGWFPSFSAFVERDMSRSSIWI